MKSNRKHVILDGEHINLEEYRAIQEAKQRIKVLGDQKRDLSAQLKSVSQKLSDELRKFFGWKDEE